MKPSIHIITRISLLTSFIIIAFLSSSIFGEETDIQQTHSVRLVFVGDIMQHLPQISSAFSEKTKTYDFEPSLQYVKNYITDADIAAGNLELTFGGPPYAGYPRFSIPDSLAVTLKNAGFDILFMANNHSLDTGGAGLSRTIDIVEKNDFLRLGTYRNSSERELKYPLIIEKNGIKIAFLNFTCSTNGNKISKPGMLNLFDPVQIAADVIKADQAGVDYKIAFIHWGNEYEREESAEQRNFANLLLMLGIDVVIGSHPHVVQPIRFVELPGRPGKIFPVIYSLGNFISNQRERYRNGGIAIEMTLSKNESSAKAEKISYLPFWVHKKLMKSGKSAFYVLPVKLFESNESGFEMTAVEKGEMRQFIQDTRTHLKEIPESDYVFDVMNKDAGKQNEGN